jgi:arabinogalactan endo-1,4-beta-galactosidase
MNYARLRVWHSPANGENNLSETLALAQQISAAGLKLLLNIHYSDTWADPGSQTKPVAWQGVPFEVLKDSVYEYTADIIGALYAQNTPPAVVQVGNEVICGFLWDEGRVCDSFNTPQQWSQFGQLLNEGIRAVRENTNPLDSVRIMIHIDRGGDNAGSQWFFDNLLTVADDFDIIGQSFYPWWHGTLDDLEQNLNDLAPRYGKPIVLVETAYPWTLGWYDNTHNIVGLPEHLLPGYPGTVDGQRDFLIDVMDIVRAVPEGRGLGLFYWGTELISAPQLGSVWENVTLFDFPGEVLSSIEAFRPSSTSVDTDHTVTDLLALSQNFPNPFNPETTIRYSLGRGGKVSLTIFNQLGKEVVSLVNEWQPAGTFAVTWDATDHRGSPVATGVYYARLTLGEGKTLRSMLLLR